MSEYERQKLEQSQCDDEVYAVLKRLGRPLAPGDLTACYRKGFKVISGIDHKTFSAREN
jgi:hypothetical protein